jgi:FAD/FMN-containing dehydrogenase
MAGSFDRGGFESLARDFSGDLLRPNDEGYDDARRVHNALVDKRPALIARCLTTADIVAVLAFGRDEGFEISVRGGGHNVAGRAVTEGGVMIDLSLMRAVDVDTDARTARAYGGATWREFNDAAAAHSLATTGGLISTTGVAGLTLGGGIGWLMGKYGLAADNLRSVELVTASGDVVNASDRDHPDLFWALRGAGSNFGVAASFEFQLHHLSQITGGLVAFPLDAARDVLQFYREFTTTVPDELTVASGLVHAPDGSGVPLAAIVVCHCGEPAQAEIDLKTLMDFGAPAMAQVGPMPYPQMNILLDDAYPPGVLNYWKSSFLELHDEAISVMVDQFESCPSPMSGMFIEHWHGAATRVDVTDTPVPHREPGHNLLVTSEWTDPATTEENIAWARDTFAALEPHFARGRYLNYLDADDTDDAVRAAYGANYARLAELKRQYDPDNVFRLNHNIRPAMT